MLPAPPKLPFAEIEVADQLEAAIPLREGVSEFRPRSRGWRTAR